MNHEPAPHTFVAESRELLREMEQALLTLEQSPRDAEAVNAVFRAMHTIKGSSGLFGFDAIVEFTHAMETVVGDIRAGRLAVDDLLVALLLACSDHVTALIDCLETDDRLARLDLARADGADLLRQLECYAAPDETTDGPQLETATPGLAVDRVASDAWHVSVRFGADVLRHGMDPLSFLRYLATLGEIAGVAPMFHAMPRAGEMDPERCYAGVELQFRGDVQLEDIEGVFEYVREDSAIRILPPHAALADYMALVRALPEGVEAAAQCLVECGALTPAEVQRGLREQSPAASRQPAAALRAPLELAAAAVAPRHDGRFVRVDAAKLDDLINLVGELVIASAGVSLAAHRVGDTDLREATAGMGRLVEEVRDGALALRMVPIAETFNRFHRVVRDLGRELHKEVELVISGGETELDKSMVEKLNDPLMHLVRNALDHGLEPAQHRLAAGKPARGRIALNAYHETGTIVIEVADDGAGLDRERILAVAVERGLVTGDQALSEQEVFQLVTEPGFSTATALTSVSGRGVGMDVVRRNVESLRGSLSIESVAGEGTVVALRVPLTLAIIDGFLVGVGRSTYVIPLKMVVECLELPTQDRDRVRESGYVNLRGEVLPLLRLREVFDAGAESGRRENVVVVSYGDQRAGFVVDALLGEFQTVIKPLGRLFDGLAGISGSTILGSGEVALIVDVPGLVQKAIQGDPGQQPRNARRAAEPFRAAAVSAS